MTTIDLKTYLLDSMGKIKDYLGWTVDNLLPIENDLAIIYGLTDADQPKLALIGKVLLWKQVMIEVSADYKFSSDGGSYDRNQVYEMAKQNYELALQDALVYMSNYQIQVGEVTTEQNPYRLTSDTGDL